MSLRQGTEHPGASVIVKGPRTIRGVRARAQTTVEAPMVQTWAAFVPIELADVFPNAKGPIPAVTGTSGQTGRWDSVGNARNVHLGNGATVREEITFVDPSDGAPPTGTVARFGYRVSGFTGPLGLMAREAHGEWVLEESGQGRTLVTWVYTFVPTGALAALPLRLVIGTFWRAYMKDGIENVRRIAEQVI